jgi:hypothetical protein
MAEVAPTPTPSERRKFDFVPPLVGVGVGLVDGALLHTWGAHPWRMLGWRAGLVAAGISGELFFRGVNPDLTYGAMTAGSVLLGQHIAVQVANKATVIPYAAPQAVPTRAQPSCSACSSKNGTAHGHTMPLLTPPASLRGYPEPVGG